MELAPVVLFTYNRPWHTQQVVEALKRNELSELTDLVIYSDGPKDEANIEDIKRVRDYLKTINGFKTVNIVESENNIGLADSVITGVTEAVRKHGKVIALEDDLVTAPIFLRYMNEALERYENEAQVMQISGHMFDVDVKAETDAIFLPFTTSWGWATWKRAWNSFDPYSSGYEKIKKDRVLRYKFNLNGSYDYFRMIDAHIKGKIDSWAIRWYLSVFMVGGLTLHPVTSFIRNIGFDGSGIHCGRINMDNKRFMDHLKVNSFPNRIETFSQTDFIYSQLRKINTNAIPLRILRRISRWTFLKKYIVILIAKSLLVME